MTTITTVRQLAAPHLRHLKGRVLKKRYARYLEHEFAALCHELGVNLLKPWHLKRRRVAERQRERGAKHSLPPCSWSECKKACVERGWIIAPPRTFFIRDILHQCARCNEGVSNK